MSSKTASLSILNSLPLQISSQDIWQSKYQLKDKNGEPVDEHLQATFARVAKGLAAVEADPKYWEAQFLWAFQHGAIPAGRILATIGSGEHLPTSSAINCTVSDAIPDSMDGILTKLHEAGLTLKAGCGIGYEFSTLRPSGSYVAGAGSTTSGPLSFMDIFDKTCFTISSAGGRRGAQMATFDICHPDVENFIKAKREKGRLRQFNCSLLITDEFVEAVKSKADWALSYPITSGEMPEDPHKLLWRDWPIDDPNHLKNDLGQVACEIHRTVPAKRLWDLIMSSTYDYAEPGFILIDRVNRMNNNWFCESIRATNPCGEQNLPSYGACLLGSINLTQFVNKPFTSQARFDFALYKKVIAIFTRALDNVCEMNNLPLEAQRQELARKRRHGMGYLGLGSTLNLLGIRYGSDEAIKLTGQITETLAVEGWKTGVKLAKEKGMAPLLDETFTLTKAQLKTKPSLAKAGYKVGDPISGRVLFAASNYMQRIFNVAPTLKKSILKHGVRFTHHSSIAPTGTISLSIANNASNGIEPSFAVQYSRNVIQVGRKAKVKMTVYSFEALAYRHINGDTAPLPDFTTADDLTPSEHIKMQAAAQYWIDSSISKTINVPTEIPFDDFQSLYLEAIDADLKGCTTFRFNPDVFQGVLVKDQDLKKTTYQFTLDDGTLVEAQGDESIEYDGQTHTAANLYDALSEGVYGKF